MPSINPVPQGRIVSNQEALELLPQASFFGAEAKALLEDWADRNKMLILPPGTRLAGDICFDWEDPDNGFDEDLDGILALGDLAIDGDLVNLEDDHGPWLVVCGTLVARNIVKGGSIFLIQENLVADGLIVADYNHGRLFVGGNATAKILINMDHYVEVTGHVDALKLDDTMDLRQLIVPDAFRRTDDVSPSADLLLELHSAGRSILLARGNDQA